MPALTLSQHDPHQRLTEWLRIAIEILDPILVARSTKAVSTLIADPNVIVGLEEGAIGGSISLSCGYIERVRRALDIEASLFWDPVKAAQIEADAPLFGVLLASLQEVRG